MTNLSLQKKFYNLEITIFSLLFIKANMKTLLALGAATLSLLFISSNKKNRTMVC